MIDDILYNFANKIFSLPILKDGFFYPSDYIILILSIISLFVILREEPREKKPSRIAYILFLLIQSVFIFALLSLIKLNISSFSWAPNYEPSGLQYVMIVVWIPLITVCGLLNMIASLGLNLKKITKILPFIVPLLSLSHVFIFLLSEKFLTQQVANSILVAFSYITYFVVPMILIIAVALIIIETKRFIKIKKRF